MVRERGSRGVSAAFGTDLAHGDVAVYITFRAPLLSEEPVG